MVHKVSWINLQNTTGVLAGDAVYIGSNRAMRLFTYIWFEKFTDFKDGYCDVRLKNAELWELSPPNFVCTRRAISLKNI